jgi:FeS assembly SUF system protein
MTNEEAHNEANHTPEEAKNTEEVPQSSEASQNGEGKSGGPVNDEQLKEMAVQVVKSVYDPEIPVDIYELGLIYEITVYPVNNLYVKMTLTSPSCPVAGTLPSEVETKLAGIKGVNNVDLELTFEPPWDMSKMSEEARLELGLM